MNSIKLLITAMLSCFVFRVGPDGPGTSPAEDKAAKVVETGTKVKMQEIGSKVVEYLWKGMATFTTGAFLGAGCIVGMAAMKRVADKISGEGNNRQQGAQPGNDNGAGNANNNANNVSDMRAPARGRAAG